MPSTYAHRRFGANVLEHLPDELRAQSWNRTVSFMISACTGRTCCFITMLPSPTRWVHWATLCTRSRAGLF